MILLIFGLSGGRISRIQSGVMEAKTPKGGFPLRTHTLARWDSDFIPRISSYYPPPPLDCFLKLKYKKNAEASEHNVLSVDSDLRMRRAAINRAEMTSSPLT